MDKVTFENTTGTCFANAVAVLLLSCPSFQNLLNNKLDRKQKVSEALLNLWDAVKYHQTDICTKDLIKVVDHPEYEPEAIFDPHEFLQKIIERLEEEYINHDELLRFMKVTKKTAKGCIFCKKEDIANTTCQYTVLLQSLYEQGGTSNARD